MNLKKETYIYSNSMQTMEFLEEKGQNFRLTLLMLHLIMIVA